MALSAKSGIDPADPAIKIYPSLSSFREVPLKLSLQHMETVG